MKSKKVYNKFQINLILFASGDVLLTPILIMIAYIFDLHDYTSTTNIILIAILISLVDIVVGILYLLIKREQLKRKLKPTYNKEFSILLIMASFGVLGIGIMFTYLGGELYYVPHVITPLFIFTYLVLLVVGEKYFNVNLLRK